MTIAEYHDGTAWQSLVNQNSLQNQINSNNGTIIQSYFSNASFTFTGNVATQALTANTWAKITYTATSGGILLNNGTGNYNTLSANRITKSAPTPFFNNYYIAQATANISSSFVFTHNISIQIVKNGVLSSILPNSLPVRVAQSGVSFGYIINTSFFQLNPNDYIELYVLSTSNTTITTSNMTMNLINIG